MLCTLMKKCVSSWYAVIADEAADVVNREQFNLSIRWVNDDYVVNESTKVQNPQHMTNHIKCNFPMLSYVILLPSHFESCEFTTSR